MPRNKRKHPHTRYERLMLAAINSLPFKFNSPGEPNPYKPVPPNTKKYEPHPEEHAQRMQSDRPTRHVAGYRKLKVASPKSHKDVMN